MKLIGMLDSPYVRRVAVSLHQLDIPFEHLPLSVFRNFDEIAAINPVVKVPTLVCESGTVLTDSSLILQYVEATLSARSLLPGDPTALAASLHTVGLALGACEKAVALLYERSHRPDDKQHAAWIERLTTQLGGALRALERAVAETPPPIDERRLGQDGITSAVTWRFVATVAGDAVDTTRYASLATLSRQAEQLAAFRAAPYGEG